MEGTESQSVRSRSQSLHGNVLPDESTSGSESTGPKKICEILPRGHEERRKNMYPLSSRVAASAETTSSRHRSSPEIPLKEEEIAKFKSVLGHEVARNRREPKPRREEPRTRVQIERHQPTRPKNHRHPEPRHTQVMKRQRHVAWTQCRCNSRKDGTTVHPTWCRADSAHFVQFVHSDVRTAVLCTDMWFVYVVHVSRKRAVLRFALLRFASRTALGTYLLGFRAKEATCTSVSCACATRVFAQWCCALSVCVLWCMLSLFARGVSACLSPLAEAGQEPHPNPKGRHVSTAR